MSKDVGGRKGWRWERQGRITRERVEDDHDDLFRILKSEVLGYDTLGTRPMKANGSEHM